MLIPSPRLAALERISVEAVAGEPLFLFVARLAPPKRPELFVEAMTSLRARVPAARGVVLGDGPGRADLEELIHVTGAPVCLVGQVEDMTDWYRRSWGVCLFSDFESLPFVVQEAMWAGRPVITSDLPGVEWFAGDTVRYVREPTAAVEALHELCDPAIRVSRGRAGRQRARSMLAPDRLYQTLVDAYSFRA